jgi:hypothetical protein
MPTTVTLRHSLVPGSDLASLCATAPWAAARVHLRSSLCARQDRAPDRDAGQLAIAAKCTVCVVFAILATRCHEMVFTVLSRVGR